MLILGALFNTILVIESRDLEREVDRYSCGTRLGTTGARLEPSNFERAAPLPPGTLALLRHCKRPV